jgi:hypothetical protein
MKENRERWMELAEMAVNEQDPDKFFKLIEEINSLLAEKEDRLSKPKPKKPKEDS